MKTGPLFQKLYDCLKKVMVCQGGGDAGKTSDILKLLAIKAIEEKNIITVTGQDLPNLKGGALRLFQKYIASDKEIRSHIRSFNKQECTYYFKNESIIEFKAFDDEQDARGSERDYLYINECNSQTYAFFWQLQRKTRKQTFLDYNPTSKFWVHEKLLSGEEKQFRDKVQLFITDHRHNPFLTEEEHQAYEDISDPDLFRVYSRGLTGEIKGLILGHFKEIDKMPTDCQRYIWAIDYGYTNDPTALVKIGVKGRSRYVQELCYEPGISAKQIYDLLQANGYNGEPIYSEHEVDMISQLRRLGLPVFNARKGPGSTAAGLSKMKEYDCYYTADSLNFKKEKAAYKWVTAQDLQTGKEIMTNIPVDYANHLADATRYGIYTDSFKNR